MNTRDFVSVAKEDDHWYAVWLTWDGERETFVPYMERPRRFASIVGAVADAEAWVDYMTACGADITLGALAR